jgi:hypothetical protein
VLVKLTAAWVGLQGMKGADITAHTLPKTRGAAKRYTLLAMRHSSCNGKCNQACNCRIQHKATCTHL